MNSNTSLYTTKLASPKSRSLALVLCVFGGIFGAHRFYLRKDTSAILYLFTLGFFLIGVVIDIVLIAFGQIRDGRGHQVTSWSGYEPINIKDSEVPCCPRCKNTVFVYKPVHSMEALQAHTKSTTNADDAKRIRATLEKEEILAKPQSDIYIIYCAYCGQIV
ncbi:MAG: TM2 domain-containing protein [Candidatus Thorarchaeota archaeon]